MELMDVVALVGLTASRGWLLRLQVRQIVFVAPEAVAGLDQTEMTRRPVGWC